MRRPHRHWLHSPTLFVLLLLTVAPTAAAQRGLRGQIFLPNGAPIQKITRFMLITDANTRNEIHFTDSNGRITIPSPPAGTYRIIVDSDGETYDTTVAFFDSRAVGNYVSVHLLPLQPKSRGVIGKVDARDLDREVSPKAKEIYDTALQFIQAQQYEQAIEPLKQALAIEKNYFQARNDLGVVYMKLKRYAEAESEFKQAIKISDAVHLPFLNLGIVLNRQRKHKEAADVLLRTQRRQPELETIHTPLIEALFGAAMWREAEVAVKRAMHIADFDKVDLQVKLGNIYLRQSRYADAVAVLREAVMAEPDHALAQFDYGAALLQTGALDAAEKALLRAAELRGGQMPGVQLMLGQLYFQKKHYDKAIAAFELYLRYLPDAPNAAQVQEAISKLRQAKP